MQGIYLYCIRGQPDESEPVDICGVNGEQSVRLFPFRQLEAVISEVALDKFASDEVQRKAKEDLDWIKEKSLAHQRVIQESAQVAGRPVCVIPMRFGTIFRNSGSLEEMLSDNHEALCDLIERLHGKQEWSVKVYRTDQEALDAAISEASPKIQAKKEEIDGQPEGMAFFMEQELEEIIAREREKETNRICEEIFHSLEARAADGRRRETLARELTGRTAPMIFNAAYLVLNDELSDFRDVVGSLKEELILKGLSLECTGPLPPFSFSEIENS